MANILITQPTPIAAIAASRGTGAANLLTGDPREIWLDSEAGGVAVIDIDLGVERIIDTIFLACLFGAADAATWWIKGGLAAYEEQTILDTSALRVPERDWRRRTMSHALWFGSEQLVRYIRIGVEQPAGADPLAIGALIVGDGFQPKYNKEWGSGRSVKDMSTVTRLPSGGVAVVEGGRYASYGWTLGDLSEEETDRLFELQLAVGESRPLLVVENPDRTAGLRNRIHYGTLTGLRSYERRNKVQTSWQLTIDGWAIEPDPVQQSRTIPVLTLGGEPLTLGGEFLTLGD
ncbi:hypothetical protein [Sphingobium yanoikuyae]|uniref:Uncharacterized protein n=1 Tax=Sphingobium yanoikuyae TaxID=13690 RepID=A0A9X7UBU4_SPHYA|nr:hypothetical protein [Sphingobium yanoikuyae]QNG47431.1 hypothetical protein H3V42_07425 [Sphingobium yanoikuyae]